MYAFSKVKNYSCNWDAALHSGAVYPTFERGELNLDFSITSAYEEQIVPLVESGVATSLFSYVLNEL